MKSYGVLACFFLGIISCNYVLVTPRSQLYYQKSDVYTLGDGYKAVLFNDHLLKGLIDSFPKTKYFVVLLCNPNCGPVYRGYLEAKKNLESEGNDSILLIPIIHDYCNGMFPILQEPNNYNKYKMTFLSDRKVFGKGHINPNVAFRENFLAHYSGNDSTHFYFERKSKIVFFYGNGMSFERSGSIQKMIESANKITYSLD